ncbi:hypothetical protein BH20ACT5_BH20ACT5_07190 [soil metagenome]
MPVLGPVLSRSEPAGLFVAHPSLDAPLLNREILMAGAARLSAQVVPTVDEVADSDPARIRSVVGMLDLLGREFGEIRTELRATGYHGLGLYEELEAARLRLLYEPINGMAWAAQKGCATALLTLQEAGRGHATMSATVGPDVLNTTFPDGSSLEELLIRSRADFFGHDRADAVAAAKARMADLESFITGPLYPRFDEVITYCSDGLGIRSRKQVVTHVVSEFVHRQLAMRTKLVEPAVMLSIGCGTALPVFEIARDLKFMGITPQLILIDQDPIALAFARELAHQRGLADNIEIHCRRLFDRRSRPFDIAALLGDRTPLIIEDTGLREYLPDGMYKSLTAKSWLALPPGGLLVSGNMNSNRPQADVLKGLLGWAPRVQTRTLERCAQLHTEAGIDREDLHVYITKDGVYSVYVAEKQPER